MFLNAGKSALLAVGILAVPAVTAAQEFSGAVTLGYGQTNIDGVDQELSNTSLDGRLDADFGNGFTLGADISLNRLKIDDVDESVSASDIGISGGYRLSSGLSFGAYVEKANLEVEDFGLDLSATSYGLTVGYETAGFELGAFIGRTETDPDLPDGFEIRDFGLSATYAPDDRLVVGAMYQRTKLDFDGDDADLSLFGIAGSYAINADWGVFGGLAKASIDELDADATIIGVGVSYDLKTATGFGAVASLELARTSLDALGSDTDLDTVRLGITFPFGGGRVVAPLNSVADAVLNPRHSAVTSTVLGVF